MKDSSERGPKTMQDFRNIFNVFNNVLVLFGLSALQPYQRNSGIKYELSLKCIVYSLGLVILIIYVFYLQVTTFFPMDAMEDNLVLKILYWYLAVVGTVMAILMITTAIFNANNFADLINNSEYFEMFTLLRNYAILKFASGKQLFLSFSILTICYIWDFISSGAGFSLRSIIHILLYFLFPIFNSLCISQFYISLFWLSRLYLNVNDALSNMMSKAEGLERDVDDLTEEHINMRVLDIVNYTSNEFRGTMIQPRLRAPTALIISIKDTTTEELLRLRVLYHKAFQLSECFNDIFSSRNLLLIMHHCALGTVYMYWAIRHSFRDAPPISLTSKLNMYRAAIMSFVSIMWLIWPSTHARTEVGRTALLVHKLLKSVNNPEAVNELQIFSLQLLQEPVSFSPHGFFELSNAVFLSMLGAVTSYLVILLQYHVMFVELNSGKNSSELVSS